MDDVLDNNTPSVADLAPLREPVNLVMVQDTSVRWVGLALLVLMLLLIIWVVVQSVRAARAKKYSQSRALHAQAKIQLEGALTQRSAGQLVSVLRHLSQSETQPSSGSLGARLSMLSGSDWFETETANALYQAAYDPAKRVDWAEVNVAVRTAFRLKPQ